MYSSNAQPTGTNRPRACLTHTLQNLQTHLHVASTHIQNQGPNELGNPPHTRVRDHRTGFHKSYGGHGERETPGPIPNPEVKPFSADGTATERLWESRTPPDIHSVEATRQGGLYAISCTCTRSSDPWPRIAAVSGPEATQDAAAAPPAAAGATPRVRIEAPAAAPERPAAAEAGQPVGPQGRLEAAHGQAGRPDRRAGEVRRTRPAGGDHRPRAGPFGCRAAQGPAREAGGPRGAPPRRGRHAHRRGSRDRLPACARRSCPGVPPGRGARGDRRGRLRRRPLRRGAVGAARRQADERRHRLPADHGRLPPRAGAAGAGAQARQEPVGRELRAPRPRPR